MPNEEPCCGWVKLFHPRGVLVTLPVAMSKADYGVMFANVNAALDAGFLTNVPGLENGEERLEITSVVRMSQENRDRTESPMIALYEHGNAFKSLTVYLDTDEQVSAFLGASGLRNLQELPLLDGTVSPERGKSKGADAKIVTLAKPLGVIVKQNPKYDPAKAAQATQQSPYTVPKRAFVRWVATESAPPQGSQAGPDEDVYATWVAFLKSDPSVTDFNARIRDKMRPMPSSDLKAKCWAAVKEHAANCHLKWSDSAGGFVPAANS